jgi:hypothetical protein
MRRRLPLVFLLVIVPATLFAGVWTTNGPQGGAGSVAADPHVPGIVYAGNESGLFRSADNGATWTSTGLSGGGGYVSAAAGATVYAIGAAGLLASQDQGAHWTLLLPGDPFGESLMLAVDPVTPTTLYIAAYEHHSIGYDSGSLSRSFDGGLTWTVVEGSENERIAAITVAAGSPNTLFAATAPFAQGGGVLGLSRSLDYGTTWVLLTASVQNVSALVVDPTNSSIVYAATFFSGVLKSVDGGNTFTSANSGLTNLQVASLCIDPLDPSRLYAATGAGVSASADAGATWQPMNNGLPSAAMTGVFGLAIDATGTYLHAATPAGAFDYQLASSTCVADSHTLCLNNGRFAVTADFQTTPEGPSAPATAVPLTSDTGYFWFFDPNNVEVVTKVLNGCSTNGHYWFFASGLTNVGVQISVTDTLTGASKPYSNPVGTPFPPVQDTAAFPCP